jgi:hypothetical protein
MRPSIAYIALFLTTGIRALTDGPWDKGPVAFYMFDTHTGDDDESNDIQASYCDYSDGEDWDKPRVIPEVLDQTTPESQALKTDCRQLILEIPKDKYFVRARYTNTLLDIWCHFGK